MTIIVFRCKRLREFKITSLFQIEIEVVEGSYLISRLIKKIEKKKSFQILETIISALKNCQQLTTQKLKSLKMLEGE